MRVCVRILLICLLLSCSGITLLRNNHYHQTTLELLTNDSVKYWTYIPNEPSLNSEKESGVALFRDGLYVDYEENCKKKRIIYDINSDVICDPFRFSVRRDSFLLSMCGGIVLFKILKLNNDTLELKELSEFNFAPNDTILQFVKSKDQQSRPISGELDSCETYGPVMLILLDDSTTNKK